MQTVFSEQTLNLPQSRTLVYAEYGTTSGKPVLFFHGSPGSHYVAPDLAKVAGQLGIRLIAWARPGYGASTALPGRRLPDCIGDVTALLDHLNVAQVSLLGFSGGSPYPLAYAAAMPHRVAKIALAGVLAPLDVPDITRDMPPSVSGLYALAGSNPNELRKIFTAIAPEALALFNAMSASANEWDKQILTERSAEFVAEYQQTLKQNADGVADDFIAAAQGWGFQLREVAAETHLWCGSLDVNTPPAMGEYVAKELPHGHLHLVADAGHFLLYRRWEEILRNLLTAD